MSELRIEQVTLQTEEQAKAIVLAGLKEHFGELDLTLNHDLNEIVRNYIEKGDLFLIGIVKNKRAATGALVQEAPDTGRIVRMSVLKAFRRKGFARRILSELERTAKLKGMTNIVLETTSTRSDAIQFYKANGYEVCGEIYSQIHFKKKI